MDTRYRKILVTGGSGVLGTGLKAIMDQYPGREFIFSQKNEYDLTNLADASRLVKTLKPDAILHLAAVCGGVEFSAQYPATILRDNIYMSLNILEAARAQGTSKTVLTLSTGMYPLDSPMPLKEEYIHLGNPHPSNYSYAFAKRMIEPAIRAYRSEYGINAIGLVPNGIMGENGKFVLQEAFMWTALIRRFYQHKFDREKIVIWGDGSALREHTDARDMAKAFMWCLDHYDEAQILNVGSNEEHSVKEIAYMIADILDVDKGRIIFDTTKPSGVHRKSIDNSKFVQLTGFTFTPFRESLERTIRWYCEHFGRDGQLKKSDPG